MIQPKIAIIHDWLYINGGAEKVLEQIINAFPDADLYSLLEFLPENEKKFLQNKPVTTSFIQKLPFAKRYFRNYFPFMPFAIEQFDLSSYDIIISSSYAMAKGVLTHSEQFHICYCHSPVRYAWDLYHQYVKEANLHKGLKGFMARLALHYLRLWDVSTANKVDHFIANSHFISKRIKRVYRRNSTVVYPPVDVTNFELCTDKEDFYLTASRFVPYKRIDLIVEAFSHLPDKKLIVIGDGPDFKKIASKNYPNITFLGHVPFGELKSYMQRARAFVFAAKEDFGIVPVEAMACGTPVIAFGSGGVLETVVDNETGVFFNNQTTESLIDAIERFEKIKFDHIAIRNHSLQFSKELFLEKFKTLTLDQYQKFLRYNS
ncbi:MAG: glycosyltransferase family 4 protein [Bacteroidota bacterium]|nr:glycosyltransferase family 4 protein [Bacteroidota bacterium]